MFADTAALVCTVIGSVVSSYASVFPSTLTPTTNNQRLYEVLFDGVATYFTEHSHLTSFRLKERLTHLHRSEPIVLHKRHVLLKNTPDKRS